MDPQFDLEADLIRLLAEHVHKHTLQRFLLVGCIPFILAMSGGKYLLKLAWARQLPTAVIRRLMVEYTAKAVVNYKYMSAYGSQYAHLVLCTYIATYVAFSYHPMASRSFREHFCSVREGPSEGTPAPLSGTNLSTLYNWLNCNEGYHEWHHSNMGMSYAKLYKSKERARLLELNVRTHSLTEFLYPWMYIFGYGF